MDNRRETCHSFDGDTSLIWHAREPAAHYRASRTSPALSNTQAHHLRAIAAALRQPSPVEAIKKAF